MEASAFDLIVASTREKVIMLEAGAKEVPEDLIIEAIKFGHEVNQGLIRLQDRLREALERIAAMPGSKIGVQVREIADAALQSGAPQETPDE